MVSAADTPTAPSASILRREGTASAPVAGASVGMSLSSIAAH
jgi:hypothetical protein